MLEQMHRTLQYVEKPESISTQLIRTIKFLCGSHVVTYEKPVLYITTTVNQTCNGTPTDRFKSYVQLSSQETKKYILAHKII